MTKAFNATDYLENSVVPAALLDDVIAHFDDAPVPPEDSIEKQLVDNFSMKFTLDKNGMPTSVTIKDSFTF